MPSIIVWRGLQGSVGLWEKWPEKYYGKNLMRRKPGLNLDHFKVILACPTLGTYPVKRNILPPRPWHQTFRGYTFGLIVNKTANNTHICFHERNNLINILMKQCPLSHVSVASKTVFWSLQWTLNLLVFH